MVHKFLKKNEKLDRNQGEFSRSTTVEPPSPAVTPVHVNVYPLKSFNTECRLYGGKISIWNGKGPTVGHLSFCHNAVMILNYSALLILY